MTVDEVVHNVRITCLANLQGPSSSFSFVDFVWVFTINYFSLSKYLALVIVSRESLYSTFNCTASGDIIFLSVVDIIDCLRFTNILALLQHGRRRRRRGASWVFTIIGKILYNGSKCNSLLPNSAILYTA